MDSRNTSTDDAPTVAIVGAGRLGTALAGALRTAGLQVLGPYGRGYDGTEDLPDVVLLCVPDREISVAAAALAPRPGMLVAHCSGATALQVLDHHEAFSLHPLMTVPAAGASFDGAVAAIAGTTDRARSVAHHLADRLGMTPVNVSDADRVAYHAAAAIASNQLLTVLELAEHLAASAGLRREHLTSLVRATVDNWLATGAARALTGPVVRGDEETIRGHRDAVQTRSPADLALYDALLAATRRLAAVQPADPASPTDPAPRQDTEAPETTGARADSAPQEPAAPRRGTTPHRSGSGDNDHSTHTDPTGSGHA